jgi:hypothetical protein
MDKYEMQKRIFTIVAVLLLLSVVSLIAVIPRMFQEVSHDELPKQAAIATLVGMSVHLLLFIGFLVGIRLTKLRRRINREINLAAAVVLFILGFIILDGAIAYINQLLFVSIGMFLCGFFDLAAIAVSVAALFYLKPKKKK